ncbi:hypothetical protein IW262DRAFT_269116 [Armillaria fumosa]|nr:hypothetical protein IW262DRAFT_269116 [Armillaria fumosa]
MDARFVTLGFILSSQLTLCMVHPAPRCVFCHSNDPPEYESTAEHGTSSPWPSISCTLLAYNEHKGPSTTTAQRVVESNLTTAYVARVWFKVEGREEWPGASQSHD